MNISRSEKKFFASNFTKGGRAYKAFVLLDGWEMINSMCHHVSGRFNA